MKWFKRALAVSFILAAVLFADGCGSGGVNYYAPPKTSAGSSWAG